ncbi:hypothetical protein SCUCBS95973_006041 [Sporothrix curviconia]|uniref:Siderophore esterase IroE-like protein n=1 Tax=Sporothrix curviconia TaxID=1260050 RepID=A0ABP0C3T6_9PEZI
MTAAPANTQVGVPNTLQRLVETEHGVLQVMVSWPLGWKDDGTPADDKKETKDTKDKEDKEDVAAMSVIYVLDGNAYFLTATDIVRRQQYIARKKAIVVGIGYPGLDGVYGPRRNFDLTPPAEKGLPQWPVKGADGNDEKNADGSPKYWKLGGAAHFHKTLTTVVMPAVERDMVPGLPWDKMKKVLFGHSFGGLFTLFSLFSAPGAFDVYIAASPSIWFNDRALVEEQEQQFLDAKDADGTKKKKPLLYINSGSAEEDDLYPKPGDTDEKFKEREGFLKDKKINTYAREMAQRLEASGKLGEVWLQEFALEDHGSAAVVGLQRGINKLLGEWWVGK